MTHIASQPVVIDGCFMRQRCAWCGAILLDYDLSRMASIDGKPPAAWETGALVESDDNRQSLVVSDQLPDATCAVMELAR